MSEELETVLSESGAREMIPVYVWYQDIDHEQAERTVAENLGFSGDEIVEMAKSRLSDAELAEIERIQQETFRTTEEINHYLEVTKSLRQYEAEYTDQYISEERNIKKGCIITQAMI